MAIVPYRRLAGEFDKTAKDGSWRRLGGLIDRNFEDIQAGGAKGDIGILDLGDGAVVTGYTRTYRPMRESTLVLVYGALTVAGSTATIATVLHDGASVGTLTIAASATLGTLTLDEAFDPTDEWQVQVTQAGSGAAGLAYFGKFD